MFIFLDFMIALNEINLLLNVIIVLLMSQLLLLSDNILYQIDPIIFFILNNHLLHFLFNPYLCI